MKCKTFFGNCGEVVVEFNNWAKGKVLTRDVIIHTSVHHLFDRGFVRQLSIVVYYPEGSAWDKEEADPMPPIFEKPIPQIKVVEVPITS